MWPDAITLLKAELEQWLANGCDGTADAVCYNKKYNDNDIKCIFSRQRAAGGNGYYYDTFTFDVACRPSTEGKLWIIYGSGEATGGLGGDNAFGNLGLKSELSTAIVEELILGLENWLGFHHSNVIINQ